MPRYRKYKAPTKPSKCTYCNVDFTSKKHSQGWTKYCHECSSKNVWNRKPKSFKNFSYGKDTKQRSSLADRYAAIDSKYWD